MFGTSPHLWELATYTVLANLKQMISYKKKGAPQNLITCRGSINIDERTVQIRDKDVACRRSRAKQKKEEQVPVGWFIVEPNFHFNSFPFRYTHVYLTYVYLHIYIDIK